MRKHCVEEVISRLTLYGQGVQVCMKEAGISEGGRCLINNQARSSVRLIEESLILIINAPAFPGHVVGFCTPQKLGVVMWQIYTSEILRVIACFSTFFPNNVCNGDCPVGLRSWLFMISRAS